MKNEESLSLIHQMISEAKKDFHKVSPYFIIWGVVMALCGVSEHVLVYQLGYKWGFASWGVLSAAGGIASMIYTRKEDKRKQSSTFFDRAYSYLWGGFGITLFLIIGLSVASKQNPTPYVLLATGLPTFATGGIIRFRPLILGGLVFWAVGAATFFVSNANSGLLFSLAIVLGYLIPGFLLRKTEKQANE